MNIYKKFRAVALVLLSAVAASAVYLFLHAKDDGGGAYAYKHSRHQEYRGAFGTTGRTDVAGEALGLNGAYVSNGCCENSLDVAGDTLAWHEASPDPAADAGDVNAAEATAVPEPETYAMLMAGVGVLGAIARRRKQSTA